MTPYAYSISDYDNHSVFSTLDIAVNHVKSLGWSPWIFFEEGDPGIEARHADGTKTRADLSDFVIVNEIDEADVSAYIDKLRHEALERDRTEDETARLLGLKPSLVTGSAPIYMLDRQHLINREIRQRRYSWR